MTTLTIANGPLPTAAYAPPPPPPPGPPLVPPARQELLLPQLILTVLQVFSQGILLAQLSTYLSSPRVSRPVNGRKDGYWFIGYVLLVSVLSVAQTFRYIFLANFVLIHHKDILSLRTRWVDPLLNALISATVRSFFIHRTYTMARKLWILLPLVCFQLAIFACQIWLVVKVHLHYDQRYVVIGNVAFDLSTIGSMILDIMLCSILCFYVLRSRSGIDYLDRFLERIVIFFWSCTIPPTLTAIPAVVVYHVLTSRVGSSWCALLLAMGAKLYHHSLLRSLNSRDRHRARLESERDHAFQQVSTSTGVGNGNPVSSSTASSARASHLRGLETLVVNGNGNGNVSGGSGGGIGRRSSAHSADQTRTSLTSSTTTTMRNSSHQNYSLPTSLSRTYVSSVNQACSNTASRLFTYQHGLSAISQSPPPGVDL
ncbi:hypothetical protein FRC18_009208 [Serendipita sp. 400]|nr:hypothetical protein FRC18_009208 [Serendipita sp. 400]